MGKIILKRFVLEVWISSYDDILRYLQDFYFLLKGNTRGCRGRAWAFERRPGRELRGHDDLVIQRVPSRRSCEEKCLDETRFVCRSAEYHTEARI